MDLRSPTCIALSLSLLACGCTFLNPKYDGNESGSRPTESESESESVSVSSASSMGSVTATTAVTTETSTTPTTEVDSLSTTIDDPSTTTSDTTVDPSQTETEGETTSTSEDSSSTADTDDVVCETPEPNNSLDIDLQLYEDFQPWVQTCDLPGPPPSLVRVDWEEGKMYLKQCFNNNCSECDLLPYFILNLQAPLEDQDLLPNPDTVEDDTCMGFYFEARKPIGNNQCVASSFALLDPGMKPRFLMIDGQWEKPMALPLGPNWSIVDDDVCPECDDCCDPYLAGTYGFQFAADNFDGEPPTIFPQEEAVEIHFFGHGGALKAFDALVKPDCEAHVELILTTL